MSGSVIHSQSAAMVPAVYSAGQSAQLPVAIDYPAALALRQMSMVHDELPKYLLAPEVSALLHYVPDLRRKMLLATLWNTGARINEALALTRGDFSLTPPYPFVQLATLKQRTEKAARMNRPGFPGECFICELRLPDHRFRWKHNKLFLLLPEEYGPAFPAIVDCYTSPPT